jgi:hypothetical protein
MVRTLCIITDINSKESFFGVIEDLLAETRSGKRTVCMEQYCN